MLKVDLPKGVVTLLVCRNGQTMKEEPVPQHSNKAKTHTSKLLARRWVDRMTACPRRKCRTHVSVAALLASSLLLAIALPVTAHAQSTWIPGGYSWRNPTDWDGPVPNGIDAVANFPLPNAGNGWQSIFVEGHAVGTLNVFGPASNDPNPYYYGFVAGILDMKNSAGNAKININTPGRTIRFSDACNPSCPLTVLLSSNTTIDVAADSAVLFEKGAVIVGAGSLTKAGDGVLTLSGGNNNYTGGTTVEGGTLRAGGAGTLVANTAYTVNGGTLDLNNFDLTMASLTGTGGTVALGSSKLTVNQNGSRNTTFAGAITGNGSLTKSGTGTLLLTGTNTYMGGTTVNSGTLRAGAAEAFVTNTAYTVDGGTLDLNNYDLTMASLAGTGGAIALGSSRLTVSQSTGVSTIYAGVVTGNGSVTKSGAGTLTLTGASTYSGDTTIAGGTLQFGNGRSGGDSRLGGNIRVAGGTLSIQTPATVEVMRDVSFSDNTALAIKANAAGPSLSANSVVLGKNVVFNLSGVDSAIEHDEVLINTTNGVSGNFGSVTVGGFRGTVDYLTLATRKSDDGKQYLASYGLSWTANNNLANGAFTLTNATDNFNVSGALADQAANAATGWNGTSLTKAGDGTLILTGNNTYTGGTVITGGTLQIGNGGTTGSIAGNVISNGTLAFNRSDSMAFANAISGKGSVRQAGSGTTVLSGTNSYDGGSEMVDGVLSVSVDANLGGIGGGLTFSGGTLQTTTSFDTARAVRLTQAGRFDVAANTTLGLTGMLSGAGDLIKAGSGTLRLDNGANVYGNTLLQAGTLIGNAGSISGNIGNGATVVFDQATNTSFAGTIGALDEVRGLMIKRGTGTLTLSATSALDWSLEAGSLTTAAERFAGNAAIATGASITFDQVSNAAYEGKLSGTGAFVKNGPGTLVYNGNSSGFTGTSTIGSGVLIVGSDATRANAVLGGSIDVLADAMLGGHGTVGSGAGSVVMIGSGGTLSPGNSIGSLTINGNLVFDNGSHYNLEVNPTGTVSDLVQVTGDATINGGSVAHVGASGKYNLRSSYTILSANGKLSGAFERVTSDFAFLSPTLGYDYGSGTVSLNLLRNDVSFRQRAGTPNQSAAAVGIDSMGIAAANPVYDAITLLPGDTSLIREAFDKLSGEVLGSVRTTLIEDSRFVRDAATDRIRSAFGDATGTDMPILAYGPDGARPASSDNSATVSWGQAFGAWGSFDGDGNAAGMNSSTGGFLTGIDGAIAANTRLGLLAGYSHSSFDVDDRASSGSSDNYHLGLYGGGKWNALRLTGGIAYTWHNIETHRSVAFPGFRDSLTGDYSAGAFQVFGESGYRIDTGAVSFEPFASLAYVSLHTDGLRERGGAAALDVGSATADASFTTLGVHVSAVFTFGGMKATTSGTLGWHHAFGDMTPLSTHAFAGGDLFAIAGVPLAKDAAVLEAGLDLAISDNATLGVSYTGQFGNDARENGAKANLRVRF